MAALSHPNICVLHDVGRDQGVDYLVMEYLEGETLEDRLRAGRFQLADAVAVARQIAAALDAAHERGFLHRDLKPANIKLAPDGQVKVLDFGLAKSFASASSSGPTISPPQSATRIGVAVGTPAYMSPEQARGRFRMAACSW